MPEGARIHSVDALAIFRAALIKFAESGNVALTSGDSDVDRVLGWLERDQTVYWAGQIRKRHEIVLKWEDAVREKRLFKNFDGTTKSAVDEMKQLAKAKAAEEEARQKELTVRKSIQLLRKESMMYKGRVQRLSTSLQSQIPAAVHSLDRMLEHLDAYLQVQTTGQGISMDAGVETIAREAAAEKVGLERFRSRTPKHEDRQAAALTPVAADHPLHQPWKIAITQEWQARALASLSIEKNLPDPDTRIVLEPAVWAATRVYLERLEPTGEVDSGWFIGSAEENAAPIDPEKLIAVRLGDVVAARADFADFLALPVSTLVIMDAGGPAAIFDSLGLDIWALALIKAAELPRPETTSEAPAKPVEANLPGAN
jgi:hypothetical protein